MSMNDNSRRPSQNTDENVQASSNSMSTRNKCGACDKAVTKKSKGVLCEYCAKWYHADCQGLSAEVVSAITVCGDSFHWFCNVCNPKALDVLRMVQSLKDKNDELEARIVNVEGKLTDQGNDFTEFKEKQEAFNAGIAEKLEAEKTETREQAERIVTERIEEGKENFVIESVREIAEREKRQKNLILFNVEESEADNAEDRKAHDLQEVENVVEHLDMSIPPTATKPVRLGKKREDGNPRPLRVTVGSVESRDEFLKKAKNLAEADNEKAKNTSIKRDMTPLEREMTRNLVRIRNTKREEAERSGNPAIWVIRNNKVVNIHRQRPSSADAGGH